MTQKVNPSPVRPAEAFKTAGAIALAGGIENGYINDPPSELSVQDTSIDETQLNAFSESHTTSSLDVTIDGGEAFIYGSWVVKDQPTTVTLDASTTGQTVYLGWDKDATNGVIIGLDSAFETTASNTDKRIPLYEFDTDSSGVIDATEQRDVGKTEETTTLDISEALGLPVYTDPANASTKEGNIIFVDGSGSTDAGIYSYDSSQSAYIRAGNTEESIEDIVAALINDGDNITVNYDDSAGTLTIDSTALNAEEVEDQVNSLLTTTTGSNISLTYDDASGELAIDTSALNAEEVEDQVNSLLSGGTNISLSYDDANNTLTINGFSGDHADLSNIQSDQHHTKYTNEEAQDAVGNIISGSSNISVTYDDSNDVIDIDTSALNGEEVEDQVSSLLSAGTNISLSYDDANDTLTVGLTDTLSSLSIDSTAQYLQEWYSSGNKRADIDSGGNMRIEGELTEGATL